MGPGISDGGMKEEVVGGESDGRSGLFVGGGKVGVACSGVGGVLRGWAEMGMGELQRSELQQRWIVR